MSIFGRWLCWWGWHRPFPGVTTLYSVAWECGRCGQLVSAQRANRPIDDVRAEILQLNREGGALADSVRHELVIIVGEEP